MWLKQNLQFPMGYVKGRKEKDLVNGRKTNVQGNYLVYIHIYFQDPSFTVAAP